MENSEDRQSHCVYCKISERRETSPWGQKKKRRKLSPHLKAWQIGKKLSPTTMANWEEAHSYFHGGSSVLLTWRTLSPITMEEAQSFSHGILGGSSVLLPWQIRKKLSPTTMSNGEQAQSYYQYSTMANWEEAQPYYHGRSLVLQPWHIRRKLSPITMANWKKAHSYYSTIANWKKA